MTRDAVTERLKAANPAYPVQASDADVLFDRITAANPPDSRVGRRLGRRHRRAALAVAIALLVAAALATTAPAISNWIADIIGPSEVTNEYERAQHSLPLPPGYDWPALNFPSNAVTSRGGGGAFAVSIAQSAWECYWVDAIEARDISGQRRAQAVLDRLMKRNVVVAPAGASENWSPPQHGFPVAVFADDGGYELKQRMYADAASGHPQLLKQSCKANAPPGWHG